MKRRKGRGLTLIELLISIVIIGMLFSAVGIVGVTLSNLSQAVSQETRAVSQEGLIAMEHIVQRIILSGDTEVISGGSGLRVKVMTPSGIGRWAKYTLDGTKLAYYKEENNPSTREVVAGTLQSISFEKEPSKLVRIKMSIMPPATKTAGLFEPLIFEAFADDPYVLVSSAYSRNEFSPKSIIN